jgi:Cu2+-exporting ATPase
LKNGDKVLVRPGTSVPADGEVVEGQSDVNEAIPGPWRAILTTIAWTLAIGFNLEVLKRVVTVLVIACPHALGLAIPLVVAISTSLSARNGILVRDRLALESARNLDTIIFDETGTLTKGEQGLVGLAAVDSRDDVGIAIGGGTDVAIESAGIILVQSNPLDVVKVIELSRASYGKMIQNLIWATGYNVVALPLAAGVLAPIGILLSPAVGALFMSLNTVIVAINAQFLRRLRFAS